MVSRLQVVLIEPDVEAVEAKYFRELASRLCVCAGVTKKYGALVKDLARHRVHRAQYK